MNLLALAENMEVAENIHLFHGNRVSLWAFDLRTSPQFRLKGKWVILTHPLTRNAILLFSFFFSPSNKPSLVLLSLSLSGQGYFLERERTTAFCSHFTTRTLSTELIDIREHQLTRTCKNFVFTYLSSSSLRKSFERSLQTSWICKPFYLFRNTLLLFLRRETVRM